MSTRCHDDQPRRDPEHEKYQSQMTQNKIWGKERKFYIYTMQ